MKRSAYYLITLLIISLLLNSSCQNTSFDPPSTIQLTILYTDDEHGWMAGEEDGKGATNLMGLLNEEYGLGTDKPVLLLSGGDNWTGPAISTWFEGQGMVEVMNQMGYAAAAIGNHEFDFGLEALKERLSQADFPYLSANLRYRKDGSLPTDLGIQPYTILNVAGVKLGVVGLSTLETPSTTNPIHLIDFEFMDYETALREAASSAREAGAQVLLVVAHVCPDELQTLAQAVTDLAIPFMGGGHCHQAYIEKSGETVIATGGANLSGYAYVQLLVNPENGNVKIQQYGVSENKHGISDPEIDRIIAHWQTLTDTELDQEIGYLEKEIIQRSQAMQDLITQSWLIAYPSADIALTNLGGMRDRLPAGSLTIASVINVMPFDNVLIEIKLTGSQVLQVLHAEGASLAVGGMRWKGGGWILENSGDTFEQNKVYSVLVTDFLYAGGDNLDMLSRYDPDAYDTAIDWRQPVIDWITAQGSNPQQPLDQAVKALGQ
jgi:2',3'-cyclic-nucleotide 2'-phosphodiesterase (5'-nucleotidase family)